MEIYKAPLNQVSKAPEGYKNLVTFLSML